MRNGVRPGVASGDRRPQKALRPRKPTPSEHARRVATVTRSYLEARGANG